MIEFIYQCYNNVFIFILRFEYNFITNDLIPLLLDFVLLAGMFITASEQAKSEAASSTQLSAFHHTSVTQRRPNGPRSGNMRVHEIRSGELKLGLFNNISLSPCSSNELLVKCCSPFKTEFEQLEDELLAIDDDEQLCLAEIRNVRQRIIDRRRPPHAGATCL